MKLDHNDTLFSYRTKVGCPNNGETFYHSYARVIAKSTSHKLYFLLRGIRLISAKFYWIQLAAMTKIREKRIRKVNPMENEHLAIASYKLLIVVSGSVNCNRL